MRWLSLLLCAMAATTITVLLSKVGFVQKAYSSWSAILNASPILHYSSAFLAGIGLKLLLDKFYISHPKRSIGFNWRYPPVTIAVWLSVAALLVYLFVNAVYRPYFLDDALLFSSLKFLHITLFSSALFVVFQETKEKAKKLGGKSRFILFAVLVILLLASGYYQTPWPLIITFTLLYCLLAILRLRTSSEIKQTHNESGSVEASPGGNFNDLDDFREWFKDDSTIRNTEQLEPDLQVYAKRITERLQIGGDKEAYEKRAAQHIALCGPFGCGKSSIVASIANKLANSPKPDEIWIHSDISTWGAASGSVAHVVLSHIIDDISQHLDMCGFRSLPKHYTEAMKSGGGVFQFASTLLTGPVDIEQRFKKLNAVLETTNHKLLITLQDVDRGTGDENEKRLNDIAALLDRLKNRDLSHINFIVAMGNENEVAAEVISKATDYREDILRADLSAVINSFIQESLKEALRHNKVIILSNNMPTVVLNPNRIEDSYSVQVFHRHSVFIDALKKGNTLFIKEVNALKAVIVSIRQLKKILRRVDQAWTPGNLMGEVNFLSFLMACSLREVKPTYFSAFENSYDYLVKVGSGNVTPIIKDVMKIEEPIYFIFFATMLGLITRDYKESPTDKQALSQDACNFEGEDELSKFHLSFNEALMPTQSLGVSDPNANYLQKIIKESPSKEEINEQTIFSRIRDGNELEALAKELCCDERYQLVLLRFKDILFKRSSSFLDENSNKALFDYVMTEVKKNKYNNDENFKELFTSLVIKILNKDNFQFVIEEVASINDIYLLLATVIEIKEEAKRGKSSEFIRVLEKQNFSLIAMNLLEHKVTYEILCIISQIENGSAGEPGKKHFGGPKYEFILDLLKDKKDEQSLKILIEVLSTDFNVDRSNIYSAISSLSSDTKASFIKRLGSLENTGFDEEKRIKAMSNLRN